MLFSVELQWGSQEGKNRLPLYAQVPAVPAKGTTILLKEIRRHPAPELDGEEIEFEVEVESIALDLEDPERGTYIVYAIPTD